MEFINSIVEDIKDWEGKTFEGVPNTVNSIMVEYNNNFYGNDVTIYTYNQLRGNHWVIEGDSETFAIVTRKLEKAYPQLNKLGRIKQTVNFMDEGLYWEEYDGEIY